MRRTYKSKKEIDGALDPRDVLLTMHPKSSVFDAFYIQNIKQSKRDMSVGASMQFAASNKVRKRKYVKRVKEQEANIKESCTSAYLTPDKSLRVNKPADLFDQLLASSPIKIEYKQTVNKLNNIQSQYKRSYNKTKSSRKKRDYSSSESTDSDKENSNSSKENIITQDVSDILCHKLKIEKDNKFSPSKVDESIDKIVKNLSIFSESKPKDIESPQCLKYIQMSEVMASSPLCSTPFHEKYRGKSIYRFSPITINLNDSPIVAAVPKANENIIRESTCLKGHNSIQQIPSNHNSYNEIVTSPILQNKSCSTICKKAVTSKCNKTCESYEVLDTKSLQSTELEPFLGFSKNPDNFEVEAIIDKYKEIEKNILGSEQSLQLPVKSDINLCDTEENVSFDQSKELLNTSAKENRTFNLESTNNESNYDTCEEDESINNDDSVQKDLIVVIDRLNDSVFQKFYNKMPKVCNKMNVSITDLTNSDGYNSIDKDESCDSSNSNVYGSESCFNQTKENIVDNIDCVNNSNKAEDDFCVSFVTTRRRNGVTNNSFLTLDNSITSGSSTDFDKTVVSYKENERMEVHDEMVENEVDIENNVIQHLEKDIPSKIKIDADNIEINLSYPMVNTNHDDIVYSPSLKLKKSVSAIEKPRKSSIGTLNDTRNSITYRKTMARKSSRLNRESLEEEGKNVVNMSKDIVDIDDSRTSTFEIKQGIVLQPGKRWERSLSIYRRMTTMADHFDHSILDLEPLDTKGRKYRQSVISTMEMQDFIGSVHNESIHSRRSTFVSKPSRPTIKIVRESNASRISLCSTTLSEDLQGFLTDDCDDTIVELSKLSIADSEHEVTVLEKFHDTSNRVATARDYVLRRCNQTDVILFDECYPDTVLKNCRKIGEGVYGEVYLWRARDGRARVLKIVPIAGHIKVNGEEQKDYHEIISEIVIAMELSALRAPIPIIEQHFDEGKSVETLDLHSVMNATDVFNEVLAVRCVKGCYPSRLLDLWELYDETKGSENDTPAVLPHHQHYLVLELANAGQDLESYQFVNAEQAYALFKQVAFGLAVGEEAFQFEHRDLHWGNVLIAPTDQKYAHFVLRGRQYAVPRRGVAATVIDYSLSRVSLPLGAGGGAGGAGGGCDSAALYNDLAEDETLFDAVGDYQFEVYRLMREKLGNDWKNFEPYTNILWLHYTVDKMITALRYTRTNTKIHKQYISKLKDIKNRILDYGSAVQYVLTDNEL